MRSLTADLAQRPGPATTLVGGMGDPVAHSLSPRLHNAAFVALGLDWISVGLAVPAGRLEAALGGLSALGFAGVSVTMPHKEAVAALVDERSAVAERLGAVNCVVVEGSRLVGHNTDGAGFVASLGRGASFDATGRRCLVEGAGGAARAVILALVEAGAAEVVVVNRSGDRAEVAAALAGTAGRVGGPQDAAHMDLVVQATPVGMADTPWARSAPAVDPSGLRPGQVAADLVYHPRRTAWLVAAEGAGATVVGGLGMLVHQAADQLVLWTGAEPPVAMMWAAVDATSDAN